MSSWVPQPIFSSSFQSPENEQHFQSECPIQNAEMCGNCGTTSMSAKLCHSCSSTVCNWCMAHEDGCCLECLETFPVSPGKSVSSPPMTRMPSTAGDSLISWLTALANSDQASPVHLHQKQGWAASAISCSIPPQEYIRDTASDSTAWADVSDNEDSLASSEPATTMMICNIPCRFGQADVVEAIHSVGFAGKYDFVYLPSRSGKHNANIGYAFVEFKSAKNAERFADAFDNFRFPGTKSSKTCTVKHAHQQGFNAITSAPGRRTKRA